MINFNYEAETDPLDKKVFKIWLERSIVSEDYELGDLEYIFCDDAYLININKQYLDHDTYTDIITFDYTEGTIVSGDIFISIERVKENAIAFDTTFDNELLRVMSHGLLHLMGYKDKTEEDATLMRQKEEEKINLFHVEH